jgi:hypothetical protein
MTALFAVELAGDENYCQVVQRKAGFYIVDFEGVEFDMYPMAKVFGPFVSSQAADDYWAKYLSSGYSAESGILFMKEEEV